MDKKCYWVWLQSVLTINKDIPSKRILSEFGTAENIYEASDMQRRIANVFDKKQIDQLNTEPIENAVRIVEQCKRLGIEILTPDQDAYPEKLKTIDDHPVVLYVKGSLDCLKDRAAIAMVGSRELSLDRAHMIRLLSASIAAAGATVVSGGALGADTASHLGALDAGRPTVAVLGCGHNTRYLLENSELRKKIAENGAVISEFPPDTRAGRHTFPIRNRIISGMSDGVVVLNAGVRSGSLITARFAKKQGRELFALPGDFYGTLSPGTNELISAGTKAVYSAFDVLSGYAEQYPATLDTANMMKRVPRTLEEINRNFEPVVLPVGGGAQETYPADRDAGRVNRPKQERDSLPDAELSPGAAKVYGEMGDEPIHINEIKARTGLPVSAVNSALMELEINGFVKAEAGKYFTKIKE